MSDTRIGPQIPVPPTPPAKTTRTGTQFVDERLAKPTVSPKGQIPLSIVPEDTSAAPYESSLPYEILKNPLFVKAEWAWKRTVVNAAAAQFTELEGAQVTVGLWHVLRALAATSDEDAKPLWKDPPRVRLLQFSSMTREEFDKSPEVVQSWLLADRLTSSVQTDPFERQGQGVFLLPPRGIDERYQAIRWTGARQTRVTSVGRLVHRLKFEFIVHQQPVQCTMIAAKPTLLVHFETNDFKLQTHLATGGSVLPEILLQLGWHIEQWSVSTLESTNHSGGQEL